MMTVALVSLLAATGGACADPGLSLPMPVEAKVSVPRAVQLLPLADERQTIALSDSLSLHVEQDGLRKAFGFSEAEWSSTGRDERTMLDLADARATVASMDWDLDSWGSLGFVLEQEGGMPNLLDGVTPAPLAMTRNTTTSAAGVSARVNMGDGWVTSFSYNLDTTQLDLKAGASPVLASNSVRGQSYGVTIAKHGLFGGTDSVGLSFNRPSESYFGSVSLADTGLESRVNLLDRYRGLRLANSAQETDIGLGYVTSFFDGALALQANAGYQMNAGGQNGANGVTVLSRAKINF